MENCTVYFSGFNIAENNKDHFGSLFSSYGTVVRLFVHKLKNYGMVQFEDIGVANQVIKSLHKKPPLYLYVNIARKNYQAQDQNCSSMAASNYENRPARRSNAYTPSLTDSLPDEDDIVIIKEKIYVDENNEFVDILTEPCTGEVYVPIRYAKNIRLLIKTVPKYKKNLLAEGYTLEDIENLDKAADDFDDSSSLNNSDMGRRVTLNSNQNDDGFKINISNANTSFAWENGIAYNQQVRLPNYNKFNKPNNASINRFNNSTENTTRFDNFKDKSPAYNTPNKQFNSAETAPPTKPETASNFNVGNKQFNRGETAPPTKPETASNFNAGNKQFNREETAPPTKPETASNFNAGNKQFNRGETAPPTKPETASNFNVVKYPPPVVNTSVIAKSTPVMNVVAGKLTKYTTVELPVNEFTAVSVESVVSDTVGWVRMVAHEEVVDDMARIIMKETEAQPATCKPQVGKLVLAKYETILLRAVILAVAPQIHVRYIDYGEEAKLATEHIQDLSNKLAAIPAYSFCVKLAEQAPFKMQNGLTMKIKPVRKENDVTVVHVENGIYEKEETSIQPTKHVLDTLHDLLISKLEVNNVGFLELTLKLSPTQYLATFMPVELTEDVATLQTLAPKADSSFQQKIGEIVCAKNADGWQRVYLLNTNQEKPKYTVAFIDYATIEKVDEILPLPEDFLKYPLFSCVCTFDVGNQDAASKLNVPVDFEIKSIDNHTIRCDLTIEDVSICELNVKPWDPRLEVPGNLKTNSAIAAPKKIEEIQNSAQCVTELKISDGADVKLIFVRDDGFLYMRTRQSAGVFKKVNEYMATNGANGPTLQGVPQVGQWVAAKYDNAWFRAIVLSVNGKQATVWFLDYGDHTSLPYFTLRKLDSEMTQQPASLIKIQLKNFEGVPLNPKCLAYLGKLNGECLKAIVCGDAYEIATRGGTLVSEALMKFKTTPAKAAASTSVIPAAAKQIQVPRTNDPKIFGKNLLAHELPLGRTQILLQDLQDASLGLICVCTNQPDILHRVQVDLLREITHYATKIAPIEAYVPEMDECVLVQNEGKWYRGVCASVENQVYTIFLLDYACPVDVAADKLKRMPKEFTEEKALSVFAIVHGLPSNPSEAILNRLESLLHKNDCYTVEVLQKNEEDCYIISFPDISRTLKDEKLIN